MAQSLVNAFHHRQDFLAERHNVVSANVANANTPYYISKDLSFQSALKNTGQIGMMKTDAGHIGAGTMPTTGKLVEDKTHLRHDGNSVKLDEEMLKLNEISMHQNMVTKLYAKHAGLLRQVVRTGQQ